ncbi:hypothetical protein HDU67_000841 [Dinochytrium kinnereticum]|nr:hypothetical protein HDU67_000841 [Dinochytrium kinnereticum]
MSSNAALANLMLFVQVIGLFQKYPIIWDTDLGAVVNVMSVAVLNTDYLNLQCAFGMDYYARLLFIWLLPVIIAGVIWIYVLAIGYWRWVKEKAPVRETMERWRRFAGSPDVTCYDDTWYIYKPIAIILGPLFHVFAGGVQSAFDLPYVHLRVIIGFLSKSIDDHVTIDVTVLIMFYITIAVMIHAAFHEWVLGSGHRWRRKSKFMRNIMETKFWKRVFPPNDSVVVVETPNASTNSLTKGTRSSGTIQSSTPPTTHPPVIKTSKLDSLPLTDMHSPLTPTNESEGDNLRLLTRPDTDSQEAGFTRGGGGARVGIGLDALRNFISKPWTAGYTAHSPWSAGRAEGGFEVFRDEEADISHSSNLDHGAEGGDAGAGAGGEEARGVEGDAFVLE